MSDRREYEEDRDRYRDRDYEGGRRWGRGERERDRDLGGDRLKLVRYKILFVKRDYEVAFPEHEELVAGDFNDTDFTAWKIAEFIQGLDEEEAPRQWRDKNYPHEYGGEGKHYIRHIPEADKKYLRVYYEVLARYDREEYHYEERQVEVLEEIRDAIGDLNRKPEVSREG